MTCIPYFSNHPEIISYLTTSRMIIALAYLSSWPIPVSFHNPYWFCIIRSNEVYYHLFHIIIKLSVFILLVDKLVFMYNSLISTLYMYLWYYTKIQIQKLSIFTTFKNISSFKANIKQMDFNFTRLLCIVLWILIFCTVFRNMMLFLGLYQFFSNSIFTLAKS